MIITMKSSNGLDVGLSLTDPVLLEHIANPASNFETLMSEISERQIYAPLFANRNDLVFLDIGANIGLVSVYAVPVCKRIVAVEPDPTNFIALQCMAYPWPVIETVNAALAPKDGDCDFYQNDVNSTASSSVNTYGKKTTVRGLTLGSILSVHQLEHVDVCKIDCEGAEETSLNAYEIKKARDVVDCYWIEVHNTPTARWEETLMRLGSTFNYLGYKRQSIDGMRLILSK